MYKRVFHPKKTPASNLVCPEVGLAGARVFPPSPNPQAGVVVPAEGIVREVLNVAPAVRLSLPSFERVKRRVRGP